MPGSVDPWHAWVVLRLDLEDLGRLAAYATPVSPAEPAEFFAEFPTWLVTFLIESVATLNVTEQPNAGRPH